MKKLALLSLGFFLIGAFFLAGCGQQTPNVSATTGQPANLKIKGTVYGTTLNNANTRGDVVSSAYVSLSGDKTDKTVAVNSNGEYVFENVPAGNYRLIVTAEGYQRDSQTQVAYSNFLEIPDNTLIVTDILLDNRPVIVNYSPVASSEIPTQPVFVITFNEAMDKNSFLPALVPQGLRAMVADTTTVSLKASWSSDMKVLTLTPEANLAPNEVYVLQGFNTARDTTGFTIDSGSTNPEQGQPISITYSVAVGGVPSAPGNLNVAQINGTQVINDAAGANYADVYPGSNNTVDISWSPATGSVTGYKVYVAAGATGNYGLVATTANNFADITINNILTAIYGTTSIDPIIMGKIYPLVNAPLYIKVVAYNGDGESAPSETSVIELVGPTLQTAGYTSDSITADLVLSNNYTLKAITDLSVAYIFFVNEPVNAAAAGTASNYSLDSGAIISAEVLMASPNPITVNPVGSGPTLTNVYTIVKITANSAISGKTITAGTGIVDLAGNAIQSAANTVTLP